VGRERVGTVFPNLFQVLLKNEFEAILKWLVFRVRSHTFFVSTTSLSLRHHYVGNSKLLVRLKQLRKALLLCFTFG